MLAADFGGATDGTGIARESSGKQTGGRGIACVTHASHLCSRRGDPFALWVLAANVPCVAVLKGGQSSLIRRGAGR